jgi:2-oxoglutarate dehydrogenase E1 component
VAQDNIRVANCTTSAQYFHLLRRQAKLLPVDRRPLVIMTPKSLLRNPLASSPVSDLTSGTFRPVIDDAAAANRKESVTRLLLCSGKVIVDLESSAARTTADRVAVARVEQLAPFQNSALRQLIAGYPNLQEIVWVQEEPRNMGPWSYMEPRLRDLVGDQFSVRYVGRPERASPAVGSLRSFLDETGTAGPAGGRHPVRLRLKRRRGVSSCRSRSGFLRWGNRWSMRWLAPG